MQRPDVLHACAADRHVTDRDAPPGSESASPNARLLPMQSAMAFDCARAGNNALYVVEVDLAGEGPLDVIELQRALHNVALCHPAIQGVVTPWDGLTYAPRLPVIDTVPVTDAGPQFRAHPPVVDVLRPGPMRFQLAVIDPESWHLRVSFHHLLADRQSIEHMLDSLARFYNGGGETPVLDYRDLDRALCPDAEVTARCRNYWRAKLADCSSEHRWRFPALGRVDVGKTGAECVGDSIDGPHDASAHPTGDPENAVGRIEGLLAAEPWRLLEARASRLDCTPHALALAGFAASLGAVDDRREQVIGVPVSLHDLVPGDVAAIGPFMETLPLRVTVRAETDLDALARQVQLELAMAFEHRELPFAEIVREAGLAGTSRSPLVQSVFAWGGAARPWTFGSATLRLCPPRPYPTALDLTVLAHPGTDGLWLAIDFDATRFGSPAMRALLDHLLSVLDAWANAPEPDDRGVVDIRVAVLPTCDDDMLREHCNAAGDVDASTDVPADVATDSSATAACVGSEHLNSTDDDEWLGAVIDRLHVDPQGVALIDDDRVLSRTQFGALVSAIGTGLRQRVESGATIALCVKRGPTHLAALLAGLVGSYTVVLLDPDEPLVRQYPLDALGVALVLTGEQARERFASHFAQWQLPLDDAPSHALRAEHPPVIEFSKGMGGRLVLFTSGTTGTPRPVLLSLRAIGAHMRWFASRVKLAADDRVLQFCSIGFDAFLEEVFPALLSGATIVFRNALASSSAAAFVEYCARHHVTVADLPTGFFGLLVQERAACGRTLPESMRVVVIGGEAVSASSLEAWRRCAPAIDLLNSYGPTETTVVVSAGPPPSIGAPRAGVRLYLLDPLFRPVPDGIVGELFIGGESLAEGYAGCAVETATRFLPDPFAGKPGVRMYRTGDLVVRDLDGRLYFVARSDRQVKIRGFRVEPTALETIWSRQNGIAQAAIAVDASQGHARLVAVLSLVPGATVASLQSQWRDAFSPIQWPSRVIVLPRLPVTARGKLDRAAVARVVAQSADEHGAAIDRSSSEPLLKLIAEIAGVATIDENDDFLSIGGHSLLAMRIIGESSRRLGLALPVAWLLSNMRFGELVRRVALLPAVSHSARDDRRIDETERHSTAVRDAIAPADGLASASSTRFELWPTETAILLDEALAEGPSPYVIAERIEFGHLFDAVQWRAAVLALAARQPMLRAILADTGANHWQLLSVNAAVDRALRIDALGGPQQSIRQSDSTTFDLTHEPGWRLGIQANGSGTALELHAHHAVMDGRGIALFWRQLIDLVTQHDVAENTKSHAIPAQIPSWPIDSHADDWWKLQLAEVDASGVLPPQRKGASGLVRTTDAHRVCVPVDGRAIGALRDSLQVTGFCAALSCLEAWLHRALGCDDLVVGVPVSVSGMLDAPDLIRSAVRLLPICTRLARNASLTSFTLQCRALLSGVLEHAAVSPSTITRVLRAAGAASGMPGVVVDLDDQFECARPYIRHDAAVQSTRVPLELSLRRDRSGDWSVELRASAALYERGDVEHWAASIQWFLHRCADQPELPLWQQSLIDPLSPSAARRSGVESTSPIDIAACLANVFEGDPQAPVVDDGLRCWTRAALVARVMAIAASLTQDGRVAAGDTVGVALPRSVSHLAALLAVWRIGATPVLIDPALPAGRLNLIARKMPVRFVLFDGLDAECLEALRTGDAVLLDVKNLPGDAHSVPASPLAATAYIAFTSGSTGTPRAVICPWRGLASLLQWSRSNIALGRDDRFLHLAAPAFDIALWELLHPLFSGALLVIFPADAHGDIGRIAEWVEHHRITVAHFVPSLLAPFVDLVRCPCTLRHVVAGGEALSPSLFRAVRERLGATLHHTYGPTETSIFMLRWRGDGDSDSIASERLPLGTPVAGCTVSVIDAAGNVLPRGLIGELLIEGLPVCDGYFGDAHTTALRFIPAAGGGRAFRTGDRVRMSTDETLGYYGRRDRQVKLAGVRIELSEVEAVLQRVPGVRDARAALRPGPAGEVTLVAWIASDEREAAVRKAAIGYAARWLPLAARPRQLIVLPALPVNVNGKIDVRKLPDPVWHPQAATLEPASANDRQPTDPLLGVTLKVWAEVFGQPMVSADADLFASGGDSITAIRILARMRVLGMQISLRDIFEHSSPASLACCLRERSRVEPDAGGCVARSTDVARVLTPAAEAWLRQYGPDTIAGVQACCLSIDGSLKITRLRDVWTETVAQQCSLRLRVNQDAHGRMQATVSGARAPRVYRADESTSEEVLLADARARVALRDGYAAVLLVASGARNSRIVIAVHHAAIDQAGWRVLIDEFHRSYSACPGDQPDAQRGQTIDASSMTEQWRRSLQAAAQYGPWLADDHESFGARRGDGGRRRRLVRVDATTVTAWRIRTAAASAPLGVALCSAAAEAFCSTFEENSVAIDTEIDLRHETDQIDPRVLGWFTGLQCMTVERPSTRTQWLDAAISAHRSGVLLARSRIAPMAVQLVAAESRREREPSWQGAHVTWSHDTPPLHAIAIEAVENGDALTVDVDFDAQRFSEAVFERFVDTLQTVLRSTGGTETGAVRSDRMGGTVCAGNGDDDYIAYPLTPLQMGMLAETLRDPRCYHTQICYSLQGQVDTERLRRAWDVVVAAHDVFAISFDCYGADMPQQRLLRKVERTGASVTLDDGLSVARTAIDWRVVIACEDESADAALTRVMADDLRESFDLSRAPLSRWYLVCADDCKRLLWSHHHLLFDGWSLSLVAQAVGDAYARDEAATVARPSPAFVTFVRWLASQPDATARWTDRLSQLERPCRLWTSTLPAAAQPTSLTFTIDAQTSDALRRLAVEERATLHGIVLMAWLLCLAQLTGERWLACGLVVSQRPADVPASERIVGLCMNAVPFVARADLTRGAAEFLQSVQLALLDAIEDSHGSFAQAMSAAARQRASQGPLFDSMLVFENTPGDRCEVRLDDTAWLEILPSREQSTMPFVLVCMPQRELQFEFLLADRALLARGAQIEVQMRKMLQVLGRTAHRRSEENTGEADHEP
ncbi:non-ribosomal peptide synthetase [Paraburkholderia domus]|uniref:non-ribosomal peptide synthetase n=1 Tax=Paraburkholderia domus TaxID=2793075 RepID=UPI001B052A7F|nr:non-ribosomal peptide synthetase [Paraburkholderia domus]CAE6795835.1 Linear gramicidin synthase subunit D [Paraburkholderia domus]